MTAAVEAASEGARNWLLGWLGAVVKFCACVVLCMNPAGAIIVLGWLTVKLQSDVHATETGRRRTWPNLIHAGERPAGLHLLRLPIDVLRGITHNGSAGLRAWAAMLLLLAPFEMVWLAGWFAGWENSFNKGYEQSGLWPAVSLAAVALSLPVLMIAPMAVAHQAVSGRVVAVFEVPAIVRLIRAVVLRYAGVTLLIAIGWAGVFGVRALPVFAEQFSAKVASGRPEAIAEFAGGFRLVTTALLFTGVLVIRYVMAGVYVRARANVADRRVAGWAKTALVFVLLMALWGGLVFLVFAGQFFNYSWWSWLNQPVIMLPWLGIR